jgi:DNA-binding transcriptional LysR family regulator
MKDLPHLRSIECFVAVAREGNVARAAEFLHLTQPAVSQHLRRLSEACGLTLFTRTAKGLQLTANGTILARNAEQVLAVLLAFRQAVREIADQVRGRLRIGTILDPDSIRLGAFINSLIQRTPAVRTELTHGISGNVPERIVRDELDAGFYLGDVNGTVCGQGTGGDAGGRLFHCLDLAPFTYRVIAPPGWQHRVEGRGWDELAPLPWIGTPPASSHNRLLEPIFRRFGVQQNIIALVDQEPSMLDMVRSGVGLSLCRDSIALLEHQNRGIVICDAVDLKTTLEFICLNARREESTLCTAFEALMDVWK